MSQVAAEPVEPVLPLHPDGSAMTGPLGEPAGPPGPFPSEATGAVVDLRPPTDHGEGTSVRLLAVSPSGVTLNWANPGDFDLNLNPSDPHDPRNDPHHPIWGSQRTSTGILAVLGGAPTYAWAPHAARGVLLASVASLDPDPERGLFVEAHATGALHTPRAGPAYSMIDGRWGPRPDAYDNGDQSNSHRGLWIDVIRLGDGSEGFGIIAAAWFPFADGWVGGLVPGLNVSPDDLPTPHQLALARPVQTVGSVRRIDAARSPDSRPLPWLEVPRSREVYSEFVGNFRVRGGRYTIAGIGDDAFDVALFKGGVWQRIAGIPGLHGMKRDEAVVELDTGLHRIRVRHLQATRHWGLRLLIRGAEFVEEVPITFANGGAEVRAWTFDRDDPYATGLARDPDNGLALGHPALDSPIVTWNPDTPNVPANASLAELRLPGISPADTLLITQSHANNQSLLTASAPTPDGWAVRLTDTTLTTAAGGSIPHRSRGFSFLAVDRADPRVIAFGVRNDGDSAASSSPRAVVTKTDTGRYRVRFGQTQTRDNPREHADPTWSGPRGVALVQLVANNPTELASLPQRFAVWEQTDPATITIEIRELLENGNSELTDADFDVLWLGGLQNPHRGARSALVSP